MQEVYFARAGGRRGLVLLVLATVVAVLGLVLGPAEIADADGGYPDDDAVPCGSSMWCKGGSWLSSRSYGYRNCTDFVAWKLLTLGVAPSKVTGLGNAGEWAVNAPSRGVTVNTTPAVGAVAIDTNGGGGYGHVAYITAISGTTLSVAEYNADPPFGGTYGTRSGTAAALGFEKFAHYELEMASPPGGTPPQPSDTNPGIVRSVNGQWQWHLRHANSAGSTNNMFPYGVAATDTPIAGDWNGNGTWSPGIVRPDGGQLDWHLRNHSSHGAAEITFTYGVVGDIPIAGDWDNDGDINPGIVRNVDGQWEWHLKYNNANGGADNTFTYGVAATDTPVVGDWNGNGSWSPGVARDTGGQWEWHLRNNSSSGAAQIVFPYGNVSTDRPIVGDWDGNGSTTVGVTRASGSQMQWHMRNANSHGAATISPFPYGAYATDTPIVGDWDGN